MDMSEQRVHRMLWEARVIFDDPHHPINDRRHPKHHQAVVALKLIEEQGRRLLCERALDNGCYDVATEATATTVAERPFRRSRAKTPRRKGICVASFASWREYSSFQSAGIFASVC